MDAARFDRVAGRFGGQRILVIGDLMLDEFIWGKVSRISPEAPVPVVDVTAESYYPGGAANVARNVREFAADTRVMGITGADPHGDRLVRLLAASGIDTAVLQQDAAGFTIVKTRNHRPHQQVSARRPRTPRAAACGTGGAGYAAPGFRHRKPRWDGHFRLRQGLRSQPLADRICALASAHGKILTVDPHPHHALCWRGATAIKPNRAEAFLAAGRQSVEPAGPPLEDTALLEVGNRLLERWKTACLLITLGEQGMILFQRDAAPYHTPTRAQAVFDVSGAGDTAIGVFTLGLAAGATPEEAAELANHASGIVVGKVGTATATREELLASFTSL